MKNIVVLSAIPVALFLVAVTPMPAHAIQTHSAPEGLYVHQIGHILFAVAMLGFAFRIRRSRLNKNNAWRMMSFGAVLFALWNGWAFFGHIMDILIPLTDFSRDAIGLKSILYVHSPIDILYYILKMDHLLCVPALVFIYLALKRMPTPPTGSAVDEVESL